MSGDGLQRMPVSDSRTGEHLMTDEHIHASMDAGVMPGGGLRKCLDRPDQLTFDRWVLVVLGFYTAAAVVTVAMAALGVVNAVGYLASLLVLGSFASGSIGPLRILATLSNIAFMVYAIELHLMPVLLLHSTLLPINLFRLWQLTKLPPGVAGSPAASPEIRVPYGRRAA
jgi:hypothetical protein